MPKISSSSVNPVSARSNESPAKMSDVALRKKKNADAQAAFRARRANYISTLEETVTNLESVVLQLQQSYRETNHEAQELRQENGRLRAQLKEREQFWRSVWSRRNHTEGEEFPLPPTFSPTSFNTTLAAGSQVHQYPTDSQTYREGTTVHGTYDSATTQPHSPSVSFSTVENEVAGQRSSKYPQYFTDVQARTTWPATSITGSSSSGGDSGVRPSSTHAPNSPSYPVESPTLNSTEMPFGTRFPPVEEQKVLVNGTIDTAPFVFPTSRSLSPSTSTPPSTTPALYGFQIPDAQSRDRQHGLEGSLTASPDIGDARYVSLPAKRAQDGSLVPTVLPPLSSGSDNGSHHSDGDSVSHSSGTLAVIKAQSFGALRRTRTRTKRPAETAQKVAMDVLEARGLGMGVQTGAKRKRLNEDDIDVPS